MAVYKDQLRGTWYTNFSYVNWEGVRKWHTKRGFKTKREALTHEQEFRSQIAGQLDMSLQSFAKVYLNDLQPRIKQSTYINKKTIIVNQILPFLGMRNIREITPNDVFQWQNRMLEQRNPKTGKPYSKRYLLAVHSQLSSLFNHAIRFYGFASNPAKLAGAMGSDSGDEMLFWTLEEYRRFSATLTHDPMAHLMFALLYWCGLRKGELLALTPADIDLDAKTLAVTKTYHRFHGEDIITEPKTPASRRVIILPDFLCGELRQYLSALYCADQDQRLFPISDSRLYRCMKAGAAESGVKPIRIHDLRHSHVSLLIHLGYDAVAIAKRLGHSSYVITLRYAHLFPTIQADMAQDLNRVNDREVA